MTMLSGLAGGAVPRAQRAAKHGALIDVSLVRDFVGVTDGRLVPSRSLVSDRSSFRCPLWPVDRARPRPSGEPPAVRSMPLVRSSAPRLAKARHPAHWETRGGNFLAIMPVTTQSWITGAPAAIARTRRPPTCTLAESRLNLRDAASNRCLPRYIDSQSGRRRRCNSTRQRRTPRG